MVCRSPLQFLHSSFPWYEAEVVGHLCLKQDENCLKYANCEAPKREVACITNPGWISKSISSSSISSHLCTSSTSHGSMSESSRSLCSYCSSSPSGIRSSAKSSTPISCRSLSILLKSGSNSAFLISCKTL